MKSESKSGEVLAIAVRSEREGPMREVPDGRAEKDGGLEGDLSAEPHRGITFLCRKQWEAVCRELKIDHPWHTRRANVLVDGLDLASLIGKTVRLGTVEVAVGAETNPCGLMDRIHPGLRQALTPDCRGGVYGRVVRAGAFRVGDGISVVGD